MAFCWHHEGLPPPLPLQSPQLLRVSDMGALQPGPQQEGFDPPTFPRAPDTALTATLPCPAGLDHRARGLRRLLLRGGVRLPPELLHERHQPCHRADTGECGCTPRGRRGSGGGLGQRGHGSSWAPPGWGLSRALPKATPWRSRAAFPENKVNNYSLLLC